MLDELAEFTAVLPAWCGPDGYPRSWRHYLAGRDYVIRARMRTRFDLALASSVAWAKEDAHRRWMDDTARAAGWARGGSHGGGSHG